MLKCRHPTLQFSGSTLNVNTDKGVPSVCSLVRRRIIVKFLVYILLAEGYILLAEGYILLAEGYILLAEGYILLAEGPGVAREKKNYEKIMKKNK